MSRVAHPAGPRHGDVLPADHPPAAPEDLNELHEEHLAARRPALRRGADAGRGGRAGPGRRVRHPAVRLRRGGRPVALPRVPGGVRPGRAGVLRGQGVLLPGRAALGERGGPRRRRVHRRRARGGAVRRGAAGADHHARQQQDAGRAGPRGRRPAWATSWSTPSRRSPGSAYLAEDAPASGPRSWSASPPGWRRTPTSSSRPRTTTRSSASRWPRAPPPRRSAGSSRCPSLELAGLHSHIGSQIFDTAGFEVAAHRVVGLAVRIRDEHGVELAELDLGGGFGIAYTDERRRRPTSRMLAESLREIVGRAVPGRRAGPAAADRRARPRHRRPGHRDAVRGGHDQGRATGCAPTSAWTAG